MNHVERWWTPPTAPMGNVRMAFDRSTRTYDADGRLHVAVANLSKSNVCPYAGSEIPDWQALGLQPGKVYQLLCDPAELEKAAATFNNLPLLSKHVAVSASDHRPDLVVGSTGTDAEFVSPYLRNSLTVWSAAAIAAIESGEQRELSCAYRYVARMVPGTYQGTRYDGTMMGIVANHVAIVEEGRAGADVVVGDAALKRTIAMDDEDVIDAGDDPVSQPMQFLGNKLEPDDLGTAEGLVQSLLGIARDDAPDDDDDGQVIRSAKLVEGAKRLGLAKPMKVVGDAALRARVGAGLTRHEAIAKAALAQRFPGILKLKVR